MTLPMHLEAEQLPDDSNYYSFRYGPLVLAAKTSDKEMPGLFADDSRGGHIAAGEKIPLNDMPLMFGDLDHLEANLVPVKNKPLTFNVKNVLSPLYKHLQLIPFFRVHESRYLIYWRAENKANAKDLQKQIAQQEAEKQKLAAATIDMVYPGEQQPESDHFIESSKSHMGIHQGRHWRDANDWFSYVMQDKQREAKKLRIMYFGGDRNRHFKILINGSPIASVRLDGSHGDKFYSVDYAIRTMQPRRPTGSTPSNSKPTPAPSPAAFMKCA